MHKYWSEIKYLFNQAMPLVLAYMVSGGKSIVDTMMVGHIDEYNLAGMALASSIFIVCYYLCLGPGIAMTAVFSRKFAKKDNKGLTSSFYQLCYLNLIFVILMSIVFLSSKFFLIRFDLEPITIEIAYTYLKIMVFCMLLVGFYNALKSVLRSMAQTKFILYVSIFTFVLNIPLNYLFIYHLEMGAAGSAWATTLCYLADVIVSFIIASNLLPSIKDKIIMPNLSKIKQYLFIAIPISMSVIIEESAFMFITFFASRYGEIGVAANGIIYSVVTFALMLPIAVGHTITQRISYLLGLGKENLIKDSFIASVFISFCILIPVFLWLLIFDTFTASLFSNNIEIINLAASLFALIAVYQIIKAAEFPGICLLRAYKHNKLLMKVAFVSYWLVTLISGHLLSYSYGLHGYWIGISIGCLASAILVYKKVYLLIWKGEHHD